MKTSELKKQYEMCCNEYVEKFCKRQEVSFEFWVGDVIGGHVAVCDTIISFEDIVFDVNTTPKKGLIFKWYWDMVENDNRVNYSFYCRNIKEKIMVREDFKRAFSEIKAMRELS